VTTVYTGASADLVRGFITTPLERAIAAADGIDYLQSQSAQGVSTISARLRLNYDPIKALSEISSKVDQVRGDLPPEAEVPIINVESADSEFASAYLSFTSDDSAAERNHRLPGAGGAAAAFGAGRRAARRRSGRPHLCDAHLAQSGSHGRLQHQPGAGAAGAVRQQLLAAVGKTKGSLVQVNLTANTDHAFGGRFQAPGHPRRQGRPGAH
jgi:multidrug efflux pump